MLTEREVLESVHVSQLGFVERTSATIIERDGIEIARLRSVASFAPGDSTANEPDSVTRIANAIWTKEILDAHAARATPAAPLTPAALEMAKDDAH